MKYMHYAFIGTLVCSTLFALVGNKGWWSKEDWAKHTTEDKPFFEIRNMLNESKNFKDCTIIIATASGVGSDPVKVGQQEEVQPGKRATIPGLVTKLAILVKAQDPQTGKSVIRAAQLYEFPAGPTVYVELKEAGANITLKPAARVHFWSNKTESGLSLKNNVRAKDIKGRSLTGQEIELMQERHLLSLVQHAQTLLEFLKHRAAEEQKIRAEQEGTTEKAMPQKENSKAVSVDIL